MIIATLTLAAPHAGAAPAGFDGTRRYDIVTTDFGRRPAINQVAGERSTSTTYYSQPDAAFPAHLLIRPGTTTALRAEIDIPVRGQRLVTGRFDRVPPTEPVALQFNSDSCFGPDDVSSLLIEDVHHAADGSVDRLSMRYAAERCSHGEAFGHVQIGATAFPLYGHDLGPSPDPDDPAHDFWQGTVQVAPVIAGSPPIRRRLTLRNIGGADLHNRVELNTPGAASMATTCSGALAAGAECTIELTFDTSVPSTTAATLVIRNEFTEWGGSADGQHIPVRATVVPPEPLPPVIGGLFHPMAPQRFFDSRNAIGIATTAPLARQPVRVQVTGRYGVPADAIGVIANLTVTAPTASSYLTAYPMQARPPEVSNLNFGPGDTVANMATLALGEEGEIYLRNEFGSAHVIVDVLGWIGPETEATGARYLASRRRNVDTRVEGRPLLPGESREVLLAGPGRADAVLANVTAVDPTEATYLTTFAAGGVRPEASTLNVRARETRPNLTVIPVDANGRAVIYNAFGTTHVLVDVVGEFKAVDPTDPRTAVRGRILPIDPIRLFDTRRENEPVPAGYTVGYRFPPRFGGFHLQSLALNVTVTEPTADGYITTYRGSEDPLWNRTSSLNFTAGQTIPNQVWPLLPTPEDVVIPDSRTAVTWFVNASKGSFHLIGDAQAVIT